VIQSVDYQLIFGKLYNLDIDDIPRLCALEHKHDSIMYEEHKHDSIMYEEHKGNFGGHNVGYEGISGGHNVGNAITHEVLHAGIWCPSLFADTKYYYKHCDVCQLVRKLFQRDELPLFPMSALEPFNKWEIDFFGPITPPMLHT